MKVCPLCDERYDEEIIKFCTKDGTPLIDDGQPSFTALPSENLDEANDDFGQETIIRRRPVEGSGMASPASPDLSERIVIPTTAAEPQVRARASQAYYPPPPPPSNTGKTIVLTIFGTLAVLGFGAGLFWLMQRDAPANVNVNTNFNANIQNTNLNTNLGFDSNFNFNTNTSFNTNYNLNTNFNTNTNTRPTPTPRPSPAASPVVVASPTPATTPSPRPPANVRPVNSPTPRTGPRPPALTNRPAVNTNIN